MAQSSLIATYCVVHGMHEGLVCPACKRDDVATLRADHEALRLRVAALERQLRERPAPAPGWMWVCQCGASGPGRLPAVCPRCGAMHDDRPLLLGTCPQHGPWNRTDGLAGCPICGRTDDADFGAP